MGVRRQRAEARPQPVLIAIEQPEERVGNIEELSGEARDPIKTLGGRAEFYIPHRIEEGYGLNPQAIAQLCDQGAQLIITVDCGITAVEPARVAKDRGVDRKAIMFSGYWKAGSART